MKSLSIWGLIRPQMFNFWDSLRADSQLPVHSFMLCSGCFFFSPLYWAQAPPINFIGAVAELILFFQSKYHFAPQLPCFHDAEVPVYKYD